MRGVAFTGKIDSCWIELTLDMIVVQKYTKIQHNNCYNSCVKFEMYKKLFILMLSGCESNTSEFLKHLLFIISNVEFLKLENFKCIFLS